MLPEPHRIRDRQRGNPSAFTLIEVLVTMSILAVILVFLSDITDHTRKVTGEARRRVETLKETRAAFEAMARRTGQATLNSYWGYDDPDHPNNWMRQSELHFTTIHADTFLSNESKPTAGHGVFFQAPFGYAGTEARTGGDPRFDYLDGLLNGWGYYVEFNSDLDGRTPFLQRQTAAYPERKRFRLMELRIPAEELTVMKPSPGDPDGLPQISLDSMQERIYQWFSDSKIREAFARPIAENVVALLISPRISDGRSIEGDPSIAPLYSYDSRLFQYQRSDPRAKLIRHQLPELLDLTLIATDEGSWLKFEAVQGSNAAADLREEINSRFLVVSRYEKDLEELKDWMQKRRLDPRVFRLTVPLRGAKFSTEFDA